MTLHNQMTLHKQINGDLKSDFVNNLLKLLNKTRVIIISNRS